MADENHTTRRAPEMEKYVTIAPSEWVIQITKDGKSFGLKYEGDGLVGKGDLPIDEAAQKFFDYLRGFLTTTEGR